VDLSAGRARAGASELRAAAGDPPLRDLTRFRKAQVNERIRAIQRLEKVLQDAGIKLTSVASAAWSKSARAMLEALLSGVSEPEQLAELAKGRMRAKIPQLREALQSRFQVDDHGIMVARLIAHIDTLDLAILMLDEKIDQLLAPHTTIVELLCTIPGVAVRTGQIPAQEARCAAVGKRLASSPHSAISTCAASSALGVELAAEAAPVEQPGQDVVVGEVLRTLLIFLCSGMSWAWAIGAAAGRRGHGSASAATRPRPSARRHGQTALARVDGLRAISRGRERVQGAVGGLGVQDRSRRRAWSWSGR
jgi:hypothetical protein